MAVAKRRAPAPQAYIMKVWVQGLRNGEKWPLPGQPIELDEVEALELLNVGYVVPVAETVEARPAPDGETAVVADPATPAGLTTGTVTTVPATSEATVVTPAVDTAEAPKPSGLPKVSSK